MAGMGGEGKSASSSLALASDPTRILLGVNESSLKGYPNASISCRNAFDWTMQKIVRSNTNDFKLLFLHVHVPDDNEDGAGFDGMDLIFASPEDFQDIQERDKKRGLHLLKHFVDCCHQIGVPCEAWIKNGDPKEVICNEVKRIQPDMLVVGNRDLSPFQRMFLGTVSEFCVNHAVCPVITIKRTADETPEDPIDD
eukprot:TRINITY_DN61001_c0_g1_i1.p1 TRINITY_DN61001_c0_g1~~TRINITY_DN61001_c0_g1_i1.p1  ORF type:complete len:196 (+),score=44.29 TRINITY_DN61001_c0_g1_i1:92-679(+)